MNKLFDKRSLTIAILTLALVIILGTCACESPSKKLAKIKPEKCVIIGLPMQYINSIHSYEYKVNRIEKGVVDIIYDGRFLAKGDTIFHKFQD